MPEEKVIKSGQITLPRIIFLVACCAVIYFIVHFGALNVGYLLLTAILIGLLSLIAIDYKVQIDKVTPGALQAQAANTSSDAAGSTSTPVLSASRDLRPKKRVARSAKRRR